MKNGQIFHQEMSWALLKGFVLFLFSRQTFVKIHVLTYLALNENYIPLWKINLLKIVINVNVQELYLFYLGQKVNVFSPAAVSFSIAGLQQSTLAYFMCWVVY